MDARKDEIKFFQKQGVYEKVKRAVCYGRTGRAPVKVRWVDVNKGDEQNPDYRSRLVAMEFKTDSSAEWFSGTPPLEALRFVCSDWASAGRDIEKEKGDDKCMVVIDVKKAHLRAPATREVYVELPKEDQEPGEEDMCGLLHYSMYGTRDAAKNWGMEVERTLVNLGFKVGVSSPSLFHHPQKRMPVICHGDDFVATGKGKTLNG